MSKTTKKANTKAAKVSERAQFWASRTGQTGPELTVPYEVLNKKERRVLEVLNGLGAGSRVTMKIRAVADVAFKSEKDGAKRHSWCRNSLRRLVRGGWVEHEDEMGDGSYRVTDKGRRRLKRVGAAPRSRTISAKPVAAAVVGASSEAPSTAVEAAIRATEVAQAELQIPVPTLG